MGEDYYESKEMREYKENNAEEIEGNELLKLFISNYEIVYEWKEGNSDRNRSKNSINLGFFGLLILGCVF